MEVLYGTHKSENATAFYLATQSFSLKLKRKATAVEKRTEHNTIPSRASGTNLTLCISLNILISLFMMSRLSSSRSISSKPCKSKKKKKNELSQKCLESKMIIKGHANFNQSFKTTLHIQYSRISTPVYAENLAVLWLLSLSWKRYPHFLPGLRYNHATN